VRLWRHAAGPVNQTPACAFEEHHVSFDRLNGYSSSSNVKHHRFEEAPVESEEKEA
jgi:hypothetical protein